MFNFQDVWQAGMTYRVGYTDYFESRDINSAFFRVPILRFTIIYFVFVIFISGFIYQICGMF